jgi:phage/plasmid-associated DNA primase
VREGLVAPATPLYKQYQMWCDDAGEKPETQKMFGMRLRERGFVSDKIKRGPHKDRKGWLGIGLRADHPDPEDPEGGNDEPSVGPETGDDGPRGGRSEEDGQVGESRSSKPNSSGGGAQSGQSGPKSQNPPYQSARVEKDSEKRSALSAPSAHTDWSADPMRFYGSGDAGAEVSG